MKSRVVLTTLTLARPRRVSTAGHAGNPRLGDRALRSLCSSRKEARPSAIGTVPAK